MRKVCKRIRSRAKALRRERQQGMVLILVLCVMALLFAFGASVLAAGVSNYGTATRASIKEQARFGALSFAEWVEVQVESPGSAMAGQVSDVFESTDAVSLSVAITNGVEGVSDGATLELWKGVRSETAGVYVSVTNTYGNASYKTTLWFTKGTNGNWEGGFVDATT